MTYKHGAFAELLPTQDFVAPKGVATLPVYYGIAPVHQLEDYSGKVNMPILIQRFPEAVANTGYNDSNWAEFDLCEPVYAHFKNGIQAVGPIVLVNVFDPDTMKTVDQSAEVALTNKQGYIENDKVILNTVAIADKVKGVDFSASYSLDGTKVIITDLTGELGSPVTVAFDEADPSSVTKTEIIGGTDADGVRTGIDVVKLVDLLLNRVPTILDAPGWSHIPDVDIALKAASQKINNHWFAWVNSNLDATDDTGAVTITEAVTWKSANSYTGAGEAPCWPMAKKGTRKFHLSTLATVTMQQTDLNNDGIPYETPSNKPLDITGLCLADGTDLIYDQVQANTLNAAGIRTASWWGGKWVLWGPHTGAFVDGVVIDLKDIFDSNVRMSYFTANDFQAKHGAEIDKPMTRARVETILNDYQQFLDTLISRGALLFGQITFTETSNPTSDIVQGDFVFDVGQTPAPPGKSYTAKVQYTTSGLNLLFGGGEQA